MTIANNEDALGFQPAYEKNGTPVQPLQAPAPASSTTDQSMLPTVAGKRDSPEPEMATFQDSRECDEDEMSSNEQEARVLNDSRD